ncbi:UNKNOWN [Stylonychia lemnae]|uniref:Tubby C-terminal domain-containing protein n=1 Tax=Stylonychia lemnae TaxID=5949 RepID=A0A077ZQ00_STYLE|nr:UNKNOWN [Stylonychia lemnae]|eukprot:CDW71460.1 UNKNOWN [Stylonychia lemnae]
MYSGRDFQDKSHRFQMMAKFLPKLNEFRIYLVNEEKNKPLFKEDSHVAKVIFNRKKKQFIIKNKYCTLCSKKRDEDIAPKTHIKYTFAFLCLPLIKANYQMQSWCPQEIKRREKRSFSMYDGKPEKLHEIMNNPEYKGSLKEALDGKRLDMNKTDDRIFLRARKPHFKKFERSLSLNFNGRVKKASRKNIQIVIIQFQQFLFKQEQKFKKDDKLRVVLQHGKIADDVYILDFGYPFNPVQAFSFSLGLYYFKRDENSVIK